LAKKRASNQPIVAEEPARPEEQFRVDQSEVAAPSKRPIGGRSNVAGSDLKAYGTRSARERRSTSTARSTSSAPRRERRTASSIRPEIVNNMLANPTITVTEEELHKEYNYVISDLRSMAITAAVLIAALFVLAEVLPK
jgi:hypothetical protein